MINYLLDRVFQVDHFPLQAKDRIHETYSILINFSMNSLYHHITGHCPLINIRKE